MYGYLFHCFKLKLKIIVLRIFLISENLARQCQVLLIWTDCNREFENIGFEMVQLSQILKIIEQCFLETKPNSQACNKLCRTGKHVFDALDDWMEIYLRFENYKFEDCVAGFNLKNEWAVFNYLTRMVLYKICLQDPVVSVTEVKSWRKIKWWLQTETVEIVNTLPENSKSIGLTATLNLKLWLPYDYRR